MFVFVLKKKSTLANSSPNDHRWTIRSIANSQYVWTLAHSLVFYCFPLFYFSSLYFSFLYFIISFSSSFVILQFSLFLHHLSLVLFPFFFGFLFVYLLFSVPFLFSLFLSQFLMFSILFAVVFFVFSFIFRFPLLFFCFFMDFFVFLLFTWKKC